MARLSLPRSMLRAAFAAGALTASAQSAQADLFDFLRGPEQTPVPAAVEQGPVVTARQPRRVANLPAVRARVAKDMAKAGFTYGAPVFIRVFKEYKGYTKGAIEVWVKKDDAFKLYKRMAIQQFSGRLGSKARFGDYQAPEGLYPVSRQEQFNPGSVEYLSVNTGYPNARDRAFGFTGDALMIHGGNLSVGCYAVGDDNVEIVYAAMEAAWNKGQTQIHMHLMPMPLTRDNMAKLAKRPEAKTAMTLWKQLEPFYAGFEATRLPARYEVQGTRYVMLDAPAQPAPVIASAPPAPLPPVTPPVATLSLVSRAEAAVPAATPVAENARMADSGTLCRRVILADAKAQDACTANLRMLFQRAPATKDADILVRRADGSVHVAAPNQIGVLPEFTRLSNATAPATTPAAAPKPLPPELNMLFSPAPLSGPR